MAPQRKILDIHCSTCGAPASFDIARQIYHCAYCGADTGIKASLEEKKGFQSLHRINLQKKAANFPGFSAYCTGCGSKLIFRENEALTGCPFCGRNLVRQDYLKTEDFPELVLPFKITPKDASARLQSWCKQNESSREAQLLRQKTQRLKGFYLPYYIVKGPVSCTVRRTLKSRPFYLHGYVDQLLVNTSKQLDNLLLDLAEPFDLSDLREFDFSFLAGQQAKIQDLRIDAAEKRVQQEIAINYNAFILETMETTTPMITTQTQDTVKLSALLPVYYLRTENVIVAINGQTGKLVVKGFPTTPVPRAVTPPVFIEPLDGVRQPVVLRFTTPARIILPLLLSLGIIILPFILAFFFNGCSFQGYHFWGGGLWLFVTVLFLPVYLWKFAWPEHYEHPWIYRIREDGSLSRYRNWKGLLKAFQGNPVPYLLGGGGAFLFLIISIILILS